MSLDFTIDLPCEPKRTLGYGNADAGTRVLLNLHKIEQIAGTVRTQAAAEGRDLAAVRVRMQIVKPEAEPDTRDLTLPEMDEEASALVPLAHFCDGCPASGGKRFGCIRIVNYPIARTAEEWILSRLPAPDTLAGFLMQNAVRDFKYDGTVVRRYRSEKLFEAAEGLKNPHSADLGTDAFFHAVLGVGPKLVPWHAIMLLVWLNAVGLDDQPVRTLDAFEALSKLPVAERPVRVTLAIGNPAPDEGVLSMQRMLFAMASAWMLALPLRVDS